MNLSEAEKEEVEKRINAEKKFLTDLGFSFDEVKERRRRAEIIRELLLDLPENEVLELWMAKRKAVLFITHDLDEAIAMSDRVVVLSAGPGTHPIGEFVIDLPRPRDVAEVRMQPRFIELHGAIWAVLRDEVLKGYAQQKRA